MVKAAILFNAPPRAGKDTASAALSNDLCLITHRIMKFTEPVKDLTHQRLGLNVPHWHYEELKDTPLPEFNGKTPRASYIETSARLRVEYGNDAVAQMFAARLREMPEDLLISPDVGYDFEGKAVTDIVGANRTILFRLHREGHTFENDCRNWITLPGVETWDLSNQEGCLQSFTDELLAISRDFLSRIEADLDAEPAAEHALL